MLEKNPLEVRVKGLNDMAQHNYQVSAKHLDAVQRTNLAIKCLVEAGKGSGMSVVTSTPTLITYQAAEGKVYCHIDPGTIVVSKIDFEGALFSTSSKTTAEHLGEWGDAS